MDPKKKNGTFALCLQPPSKKRLFYLPANPREGKKKKSGCDITKDRFSSTGWCNMPSAVDVTEVNIVLAPPLICLPRRLPLAASSSYRPLCLHCPAVSFTPRPIHAHTFHSVFFLSTRPPSLADHSQSPLSSFTPLLFPVQFLNLRASLLPLCPPPAHNLLLS